MPSRTPNVDLIAAVVFTKKKTPKLTQSDVILAISGQKRCSRFDSIYLLCKFFFRESPVEDIFLARQDESPQSTSSPCDQTSFSSWAKNKYSYIYTECMLDWAAS